MSNTDHIQAARPQHDAVPEQQLSAAAVSAALHPVLGRLLRHSVKQGFHNTIRNLNSVIMRSVSLRTRMKARQSNLSVREYVARLSLEYRAEHVFLIQPKSGLLIEQASRTKAKHSNKDNVPALFSAVQTFVKQSAANKGGLVTALVEDLTIWILPGPYAVLACVWRGQPPKPLCQELGRQLERIHMKYSAALRVYNEQAHRLAGLQNDLGAVLSYEKHKPMNSEQHNKPYRPWAVIVLLGLLGVFVTFKFGQHWTEEKNLRRVDQALANEPGWHVTKLSYDNKTLHVRGLKDPLARPLDELLAPELLKQVNQDLTPFQSLAPALLVKSWRQQHILPMDVRAVVTSESIALSGEVSGAQYEALLAVSNRLSTGVQLDLSALQLRNDDLSLQFAEQFSVPATVSVSAQGRNIQLIGYAPLEWLKTFEQQQELASWSVNQDELIVLELQSLRALSKGLQQDAVYFSKGTSFSRESRDILERWAEQMKQINQLAALFDWQAIFILSGYTDGVGTEQKNRQLKVARADQAKRALVEQGVPRDVLRTLYSTAAIPEDTQNLSDRKVMLQIEMYDAQLNRIDLDQRYQP